MKLKLRKGNLIVISAPSGTGKTTLCKELLMRFSDMSYSVSFTTRAQRGGEVKGVDYTYISVEEFLERKEKGEWVEWAEVHGNYYGTSRRLLDWELDAGKDVLLDIDVQGAVQVMEKMPDCVTIFIAPPSLEELKRRLVGRGTDADEDVKKRLANAVEELAKKDLYRHIIVNDDLEQAKKDICDLVIQARADNIG